MPTKPITDHVAHFWSKVNKNGPTPSHRPELGQCWVWKASRNSENGYGQFFVRGDNILAHRFSFKLAYPESFDSSLCVLHHCDNRICIRPSHLWQGTYLDNNLDAKAKGRTASGERSGVSKLTSLQVRQIRRMDGPHYKIAERFNVSRRTIDRIISGRIWREQP